MGGLRSPLRRGGASPLDVATILGVPALLLGVASLPRPVRLSFTLSYVEPTVVTMYTSHFVHLGSGHLLTNIAVYLTVVPLAWFVSVRSGHRGRFFVTFLTVLVAFPFALSAMNVLLTRPRIGFGFSGLNMAFLGFLPHALAGYFDDTVPGANLSRSPLPFFMGATVITFRAVPPGVESLLVGAANLVVVGLCVHSLLGSRTVPLGHVRADGGRERDPLPVLALGTCVFVLLQFAAFPNVVTGDGTVLNLFLHLLGYCFGYIVPYVTFQIAPRKMDISSPAT
ncbi:hypothetical protein [Halorarum halobium]|uniref:hypothetical protein n=1 Tax=Halorarum halobium TaxID=3075121 RepID=UPI0028A7B4FC|nr:hypothetical protein [Halobaculum sp. XH14]